MSGRNNFKTNTVNRTGYRWRRVSKQEAALIKLFRKLTEQDRRQVRRITEYLARPCVDG